MIYNALKNNQKMFLVSRKLENLLNVTKIRLKILNSSLQKQVQRSPRTGGAF